MNVGTDAGNTSFRHVRETHGVDHTPQGQPPAIALFATDSGDLLCSSTVVSPQPLESPVRAAAHRTPGSGGSSGRGSPEPGFAASRSADSSPERDSGGSGGAPSAGSSDGHGFSAPGKPDAAPGADADVSALRLSSRGSIASDSRWAFEEPPPSRGSVGTGVSSRGATPAGAARASARNVNNLFSTRNLLGSAVNVNGRSSSRLHGQSAAALQLRAQAAPLQLRGARFNAVAPSALSAGRSGGMGCTLAVYGERVVTFYTVSPVAPDAAPTAAAAAGSKAPSGSSASPASPALGGKPSFALRQLPLCPKLGDWLARYGSASQHCSFRAAGWLSPAVCVVGTGAGDLLLFEHGTLVTVMPGETGARGHTSGGERPQTSATAVSGGTQMLGTGGGGRWGASRASGTGGGPEPAGPPSIEAILVSERSAAAIAGSCAGVAAPVASRPWCFAVGGSGGAVRLYAVGRPPTSGGRDAASPVVPTFEVVATATLPSAVALDLEDSTVRCLSLSPSGDSLVVAVGGCHLYSLDPTKASGAGTGSSGATGTAPPSSAAVELALTPLEILSHSTPPALLAGAAQGGAQSLHNAAQLSAAAGAPLPPSSAIVGMDVAVRRPLVATIGACGALRVWNFAERLCEVARTLPDPAVGVALHPSGLQLALAVADRVRVMAVLADDLREVASVPLKGAAHVRYSASGGLLAVAAGPVIHILDGTSLGFVCALRGHNGKVSALAWAPNDATLLSAGSDGAVYEWDVRDGKRAREFLQKGSRIHGVAASRDGGTVYACCSVTDTLECGRRVTRESLLEIDMNRGATLTEAPLPWPSSCVAASHTEQQLLFVGAGPSHGYGLVRSLTLPLTEDEDDCNSAETGATVAGASRGCVAMQLSHDGSRLFVAGVDGAVVVYDVRDRDGRLPVSDCSVKVPWGGEVLVSLSEFDDRKGEARELREQLAELRSNAEYAVRVKEIGFRDGLKELTEGWEARLAARRRELAMLTSGKADAEALHGDATSEAEVR